MLPVLIGNTLFVALEKGLSLSLVHVNVYRT